MTQDEYLEDCIETLRDHMMEMFDNIPDGLDEDEAARVLYLAVITTGVRMAVIDNAEKDEHMKLVSVLFDHAYSAFNSGGH
jgi:hypothetical protein